MPLLPPLMPSALPFGSKSLIVPFMGFGLLTSLAPVLTLLLVVICSSFPPVMRGRHDRRAKTVPPVDL